MEPSITCSELGLATRRRYDRSFSRENETQKSGLHQDPSPRLAGGQLGRAGPPTGVPPAHPAGPLRPRTVQAALDPLAGRRVQMTCWDPGKTCRGTYPALAQTHLGHFPPNRHHCQPLRRFRQDKPNHVKSWKGGIVVLFPLRGVPPPSLTACPVPLRREAASLYLRLAAGCEPGENKSCNLALFSRPY